MVELIKQSITGQYEAALSMLKQRIDVCPDMYWDSLVGQGTIRQDCYHVLFWLDYYLTPHEDQFKGNEFTVKGGDELLPQISHGLSREDTLLYVEYCHKKIVEVLEQETQESLEGNSGFPSIFRKRPLTRVELHVYNLRHLQHHMAQVGMALRKISDQQQLGLILKWYGTGWY